MNERYVEHETGEILEESCLMLRSNEIIKVIQPDYYINGKVPDPALLKYFRLEHKQEGDRNHGSY
ncbi:hypothetical protein P4V86_06565 [Brevibacillus laterosporus]|uniref:hypothetical protein n=1 Tax=Brevibacillus laterosporus TaxID=1465 RepID=UPI0011294BD5|nr:hypothetical protein [Brevibacillus laterosporus]MBG9801657.1 hypothetical protein [Brevibacillus laterosporus]MED2003020.1 hypothetical protein [Brevibacillus laterosporus]MED4762165.1 hypothetical protein [Brevibacillus laterosporus]TPH10689.1 hypothetical protein EGH09_19845 [Brevibacillus laterosporus]